MNFSKKAILNGYVHQEFFFFHNRLNKINDNNINIIN